MKESLKPGIQGTFAFTIPESKTVPRLYPEAPEFQVMPKVFATGFMVGLVEWTCIQAIQAHLDWPREQTVGTGVSVTHSAATPPGLTVTVQVALEEVDGRRLRFAVSAHDGVDEICRGSHERVVIDAERFNAKVAKKAQR
jgi:fluoroacetyl-CoA thioesterase